MVRSAWIALVFLAVGCGDNLPARPADAADADASEVAPPSPTGFQLTSGGGQAASSSYRATVRIGGAPPHGAAASANVRLTHP
ncbi:MAG: hypothetical protein R2939_00890 [Kofleriaceae bacterium]